MRSATTPTVRRCEVRDRQAFTMIEMVISAMILFGVMSLVASMAFRVDRVWIDVRHHRVAMTELSNQLEVLTRTPVEQLPDAINNLMPSSAVAEALPNVSLSAELQEEGSLTRITLQLDWQRRHGGKPMRMVAWVSSGTEDGQEDDE
ncbi:MAG: hypothetical protein R3C05_11300 [Pirellulaceae bacterium]